MEKKEWKMESKEMIQYDKPIEVTKKQYDKLLVKCAGIVAHRIDNEGKYWIKVWFMQYKDMVQKILNETA